MSDFISLEEIKVGINFGEDTLPVGRLASSDRKIYFEYDATFLARGLNISPLNLPFQASVQTIEPHLFEGLPGVFNDSLPDGWGRLLLDRLLRSKNILREEISPLDRLAHVGFTGIGAHPNIMQIIPVRASTLILFLHIPKRYWMVTPKTFLKNFLP